MPSQVGAPHGPGGPQLLVMSHTLWHQEMPSAFDSPPFHCWKLFLSSGSSLCEYFALNHIPANPAQTCSRCWAWRGHDLYQPDLKELLVQLGIQNHQQALDGLIWGPGTQRRRMNLLG